MDQLIFIARLNIEHYRRKLAVEQSEATRETIMRLLTEEEGKLAALNDLPDGKRLVHFSPFPPVCRAHVDPHSCSRVNPPVENPAARKYKSMSSVGINDR